MPHGQAVVGSHPPSCFFVFSFFPCLSLTQIVLALTLRHIQYRLPNCVEVGVKFMSHGARSREQGVVILCLHTLVRDQAFAQEGSHTSCCYIPKPHTYLRIPECGCQISRLGFFPTSNAAECFKSMSVRRVAPDWDL